MIIILNVVIRDVLSRLSRHSIEKPAHTLKLHVTCLLRIERIETVQKKLIKIGLLHYL